MKTSFIIVKILFGIFMPLSFTDVNSLSHIVQQQTDFVGTWLGDSKSDRYYFSLTITIQSNNKIEGYHDIVALNGHKIDNGYPGPSLTGTIENDIATVNFESSFTPNKKGIAILKFIAPDKIEWKTVKEIDGENYFPDEAILVRESSSPTPTLKEEESVPKEKPTPEPEKEPEVSPKWELKLSDYDRGHFEGGLAYEQCKKEQEKEGRDVLDRDRRMPIERMEWDYRDYKAVPLGLGDCREKAFERIKMRTEEYQSGFKECWRDASMPVNNKKDITKKKPKEDRVVGQMK